jgi:hypothetical protein
MVVAQARVVARERVDVVSPPVVTLRIILALGTAPVKLYLVSEPAQDIIVLAQRVVETNLHQIVLVQSIYVRVALSL